MGAIRTKEKNMASKKATKKLKKGKKLEAQKPLYEQIEYSYSK